MTSPQKKPRLSLQIKTTVDPQSRPVRRGLIDPRDPTAFNTISNAYITAIERSTPIYGEPLTAINTLQAFNITTPIEAPNQAMNFRVSTPYLANYPKTPLSAQPTSSPKSMPVIFPSSMTATPPLSGTIDHRESKVFTFSPDHTTTDNINFQPASSQPTTTSSKQSRGDLIEARSSKRRSIAHNTGCQPTSQTPQPPYTPSQARHSILRNSPLPPRTAIPPESPRQQSLRLQVKANRRVAYNSPIEQEITTNLYTRSHIDLLCEDVSPVVPADTTTPADDDEDSPDTNTPDETQEEAQTPGGPTRRRMVGHHTHTTLSSLSGIRKRKRKEKQRQWVWTIGQDEDECPQDQTSITTTVANDTDLSNTLPNPLVLPMAPIPELMDEDLPTPSIESSDYWSEYRDDTDMTDDHSSSCCCISSRDTSLCPDSDIDLNVDLEKTTTVGGEGAGAKTPTGFCRENKSMTPIPSDWKRDTPIPEWAGRRLTPTPPRNVKKRDTPIPPELVGSQRSTPVLCVETL